MLRRLLCLILVLLLAAPSARAAAPQSPNGIHWQPWSDAAFAQAKRDNKLILLDLHAVWCHWCHVMDDTTYADPEIIAYINQHFVALSVDQDSRPDIVARYEDYGWPATILFAPDGTEIAKRSGYIPPPAMLAMLKAFVADPTPGPSAQPETTPPAQNPNALLSRDQQRALESTYRATYDTTEGAWGNSGHKFINADNLEYALSRALAADNFSKSAVTKTLANARKLIDPSWGGAYQYSTHADWDHPHFEKIMSSQADNLRTYSLAYAAFNQPSDRAAANDIARFLTTFLTSPEGAFYTSMDADLQPGQHAENYFNLPDAARRKLGLPRVDTHIYARENGLAIAALVALHNATADPAPLAAAQRAHAWIIANRTIPNLPPNQLGFLHDTQDSPANNGGPYLADTLAMARASLALYQATGDRARLREAAACLDFIRENFQLPNAGFAAAPIVSDTATPISTAVPQRDDNLALARFANLLFRHTNRPTDRAAAEHAARFLFSPDTTRRFGPNTGGLLLLNAELANEPLHISITGPADASETKSLLAASLALATNYKRIDLLDPALGPLFHTDIEFPALPDPAAFFCANGTCSSPLDTAKEITDRFRKSLAR